LFISMNSLKFNELMVCEKRLENEKMWQNQGRWTSGHVNTEKEKAVGHKKNY